MQRVAFKMKLFKGKEEEYKRRHDEIWEELKALFKSKGVQEFSIFLDEETNILFAYLQIDDKGKLDGLPHEPVQKKWWTYMRDLMETKEHDDSPVQVELREVFYLK